MHRYDSLEAIYGIPARALHAVPLLASWIRTEVRQPLLVGPDAESEQWVAGVAKECAAPFVVLRKTRQGDRDIRIEMPDADIARHSGRTPVIVDDVASSGQTLIEVVRALRARGFLEPVCLVVHPLFAGMAYEELVNAGAARVVACDTIAHPSGRIDSSGLLGQSLANASLWV